MATPEIGIRINAQGVAEAQRHLAGLQGTMAGIGAAAQSMRSVLAGLTGVFSVTAVAAWTRSHVNALDAMNDLADATGATVEEISKLDQVARRSGSTLDQAGGILIKFNQALKSADGNNGVSRALQAIGLDAQKLREADPAAALRQAAVALQNYADDGNKARVVQELFGKSIREAAPFLKDLAEAGEVNAKVTAEQARQAEVFNKAMARLSANVTDIGRGLVSDLLPALNDLTEAFSTTRVQAEGMSTAAQAILVPLQALTVLGANVAFVFRAIGEDMGAMAAQAEALAKLDWRSWLRIRAEREADSKKARAELDDFERRVMQAGQRTQQSQRDALRALEGAYAPAAKSLKDIADGAGKASTAFADLTADINKARTAAEADADAGGKMSEARKLQIELIQRFTAKTDELTAAQRRSVAAAINQAVAARDTAEGIKEQVDEATKLREAFEAADRANASAALRDQEEAKRALQSVEARIQSITDEEAAVKLSRDANVSLAEAIEQVAIARLREKQAKLDKGDPEWLALEREIEARQRLARLIGGAEFRKANEQSAKDAAAEWERTAAQIEQSLTDALMNGGKSGAEYIKGLFRSMVLRPVIQAAVQPYARQLSQSLGGFSDPRGAQFGNSLAGGQFAYGWDRFATSSVGQRFGLSGMQEDAAGNMYMAQSGSSQAIGTYAKSLGTALSYADAFMSAKAGKWGEAIGTAAGTYIAGPIGGQIGKMLGAAVDKVFRGNAGTPHMGGYFALDYSGRVNSAYGMGESNRSPELDNLVGALVQPVNASLNSLLRTFNLGGNFQTGGTFKSDGKDGSYGIIQLDRSTGGSVVRRADGTLPADAKAGFEEFTKLAADAMLEALDTLDLPAWAAGVLDAIADGATTDDVLAAIEGINATQTAITQLSDTIRPLSAEFAAIANAGGDAMVKLAELSGGFEALTGNLATYYQEFYSDAERAAAETARITAALGKFGIALPQTRDEFRDLVDAQIALGDAGQPALAALLGVAGSFAALNPIAEATGGAVDDLSDALRKAEQIASERYGLETQLLQLQGDTAALRQRELDALDPSNRALQQRIFDLQDEQAAARALAEQQAADAERVKAAVQAAAGAVDALAAAAERVRAAQGGVVTALQALVAFGNNLRSVVSGLEGEISTLRQQALGGVQTAVGQVTAAVNALGQSAATAASRVSAAASAMQAASQAVSGAASAVQGAIGAQRGVVSGAQGAVLSALQQLFGNIGTAQGRVDSVRGQIGSALGSAQNTYDQAVARLASITTRQVSATDKLTGAMVSLSDNIAGYLAELTGSVDAAGPRRLDVLRSQFEQTAQLAKAGDALAAQQLVTAARAFIDGSREGSASGAAFDSDVRQVRRVLAEVYGISSAFRPADEVADTGDGGLADAQAAVTAAQAELTRLQGIAQAAGVSLADTQVDLLAQWTQAQGALTAAQSAYNAASAQAAQYGVGMGASADSFASALASLATAQATLDGMIEEANAAGVNTGTQTAAQQFTALIGDYRTAVTGLDAATTDYDEALRESIRTQGIYDAAVRQAADAGIDLGETLGTVDEQQQAFRDSLRGLADAQAIAQRIGAETNTETQGLVERYRELQGRLAVAQDDVEKFGIAIRDVDFTPLAGLTPLGDLLQQYADAVQTLMGAQQDQSRQQATEQWVDIGNGLQRYRSSGGATAISRIGGGAADMTVFGVNGEVFGGQAVKDWVATQLAAGDLGSIYARATALGVSSNALQLLTGAGNDVLDWARRNGLPAFAGGSSYVPQTGLALVHEGERILPAQDNARLMDVLTSSGDMAAEMRAMREEIRQFRLESRSGDVAIAENTRSVDKKLDRVIVNDRVQVTTS